MQTPLVSLQAPKDVSIDEIEAELGEIWRNYGGEDGMAATRAATFTLIVYALNSEDTSITEAIAIANPCRIIILSPITGVDEGVKAQVSAYCPIQKRGQSTLVCCEYITLRGTAAALERIGGIISALTISDLPKFLWWQASPNLDCGLFKRLATQSDTVIIDSSTFKEPEADLLQVIQLLQQRIPITDLNWGRLAAWQELTAEAFDPPERRSALREIDRVTLDYEQGNPSQALMYLGWIASRLQWKPTAYQKEGGDYDIRRVTFTCDNQRPIEAELAGDPVADAGEVLGDLLSLRLSSTNLEADCCTVLCSETSGCMRMEAGGGAQSCSIQQVTPLSDQKTEKLLVKQLQRWGRDLFYEETMAVTAHILNLRQ
jgi:glucose-6-phosphate dehydrogenase assembly protein OpcA